MSLKQVVIDSIFQNQRVKYYTSKRDELRIRCPYCNDSIKKHTSAHLYIKIDTGDDSLPFYCQRCNHSGYVNKKFLNNLNIYNDALNLIVHKANKKIRENNPHLFKRSLKFPSMVVTNSLIQSVNYLRKRFDMPNLKGSYLENDFKMVLDVNSFLDFNKLDNVEGDFSGFVGFLSYDNTHLNLRNVLNDYPRYKIQKIIDAESTSKVYIKPTTVDIMQHSRVFITEGVLDLFGLYHYLKENDSLKENDIFIAVNGKGYKFVDSLLIQRGILNVSFIFALDNNDMKDSEMKEIVKQTHLMKRRKFMIIRNNHIDEKDFGVPLNRIYINNLSETQVI